MFGLAQTTQGFGGFGSQPATNSFKYPQNDNSVSVQFSPAWASSVFEANKPSCGSTFGSGTTSTTFEFQQPAQSTKSLFGDTTPSTKTSLFGSNIETCGAKGPLVGSIIKFCPIMGTDTLIKNGVSQEINFRCFVISCMKEFEDKSFEEIRLEDYVFNKKGPQTRNIFGAPQQQLSLFGATNSATNVFGSPKTENKPLFGNTNSSFGGFGTNNGVFGAASSTSFNKTTFGTTTTTSGFNFWAPAWNNLLFGNKNKPFGTTPTAVFEFTQPTASRRNVIGHRRIKSSSASLKQDFPRNSQTLTTESKGFELDAILEKIEAIDQKIQNSKEEIVNSINKNLAAPEIETLTLQTTDSSNSEALRKLLDDFNKEMNLQKEKMTKLEERLAYLEQKEEQRQKEDARNSIILNGVSFEKEKELAEQVKEIFKSSLNLDVKVISAFKISENKKGRDVVLAIMQSHEDREKVMMNKQFFTDLYGEDVLITI